MNDPSTLKSFQTAIHYGGWRTHCRRSTLPQGSPPASVTIEDISGWEPAGHDQEPREGYEYGLAHTCSSRGFRGRSDRQYWSRWRRRIPIDRYTRLMADEAA